MVYQQTAHLHYQLLKLTGEIDLHNSPQVRKQLLAILKQGNSVLVDFSELSYIDSSGIATLVEAFNLAKTNTLKLTIVGAVGAPLQVLELTNLNKVFPMVNALDDIKE
jgi:anti-sigma B factor antagonist